MKFIFSCSAAFLSHISREKGKKGKFTCMLLIFLLYLHRNISVTFKVTDKIGVKKYDFSRKEVSQCRA